ncbi:MAG TPA: hypothetical protein VND22_07470 [Actinomycetota bacterium]|nr:hypothetical protein [Actinomycetota bacterium]
MLMRISSLIRRRLDDESGFTIAEALASLMVVSVLTTALSYSTISAYRTIREVKNYQLATALGNQAIEAARDMQYENIVMRTSDLAGDANILASCPGHTGTAFLDPDGSGPLLCEPIVRAAGAGTSVVNPHTVTHTVSGQRYTSRRYVTWVDDTAQGGTGQSYKRMTVRLEWTAGAGDTDSFTASSFITRAKRGLPTPKFTLSPVTQALSVGQGKQVVFKFSIKNQGIPDAYDLTLPRPAGRPWTISFYRDVDSNGQFDSPTDTVSAFTDTNASGVVDTGNVVTGQTLSFFAVWTLQPSALEPVGTYNMVLTAASGVEPTSTKAAAAVLTVTLLDPVNLVLHNRPTPPTGDTNAQVNLSMSGVTSTSSTLFRYSQDLTTAGNGGANVGRYVRKGNNLATEALPVNMVNWNYQLPERSTFQGQADMTIWVGSNDFVCNQPIVFSVFLREKSSDTTTVGTTFATTTINLVPVVGTDPCPFQEVSVPLNISTSRQIARNNWIEAKIVVTSATGSQGALFAYDTTVYPSKLVMPRTGS